MATTPLLKTEIKTLPTRERLVRAALYLFQAKGYHGTGVTEILARARAPKGSLYHHFPGGKEALALAAIAWLRDEVTRYLDGFEGGAEAMVLGLAGYAAEGLRRTDHMRGSLLSVLAQEVVPALPAVQAALQDYVALLRRHLAAAQLRAGASPQDAATFADLTLALLQGASLTARVEGGADRLDRMVRAWLVVWERRGITP